MGQCCLGNATGEAVPRTASVGWTGETGPVEGPLWGLRGGGGVDGVQGRAGVEREEGALAPWWGRPREGARRRLGTGHPPRKGGGHLGRQYCLVQSARLP